MSTLKTSDLEDMTGLSQRYWQRRIAAGEVPGATQLNLGANRRFLIEREAFTTWWEGKPSEAGRKARHDLDRTDPAPLLP